jgi:hypothetical protein
VLDPEGRLRREFAYPVVLLILLVALATIGSTACLFNGDEDDGDGWLTYRNVEFQYEIAYPPQWSIEIRDPQPGDDFVYQYVRFTSGDASVSMTLNFQGDWCMGTGISKRPIVVDGVEGIESICSDLSVRHFERAIDGNNYTLFAQPNLEDPPLRQMVESFRFLR